VPVAEVLDSLFKANGNKQANAEISEVVPTPASEGIAFVKLSAGP